MSEDSSELTPIPESQKEDIQQVLQEVPDEVLIRVIADRIQQEPNKKVRKVIQTVSQQTFSGPIPPPAMLGEYDTIQNGLADRIVSMAESQQTHRQSLEKQSVEAAISTESRGQHYALLISVVIIAGALYLIDSGKEISGSILAGGTLTGLAYIFITGRKEEPPPSNESEDPS